MEMDQYEECSILFSASESLETSNSKTTKTVAGHPGEGGFRNGVGGAARFYFLFGFHQISSWQVVVVDFRNDCLRQVDRLTGRTTTFSGTCTKSGFKDGSQSEALFRRPYNIIPDSKNQNKLLVTDRSNDAVRHVDKQNGYVSTFYQGLPHKAHGITQDIVSGDLYITATRTAVYKLTYQRKELTHVAGSRFQLRPGSVDWSMLQFRGLRELLLIDHGKKLLVVDGRNGVQVVDIESNMTSSLCTGTKGQTGPDLNSCSLIYPYSLMVAGDSLYIGMMYKIIKVSGMWLSSGQT